MKVTDISADIRVGAVNIVGRRASEKGYRRLRRGNEKRREAERVRFLHATSRNYRILLLFRPIQHGCNSQAMVLIFQHFFFNINLVDASAATPLYARIRPFSPRFDLSVHTERTRKNGHLHKTLVRLLACASPSQRSLRQRDLSEDARRWATETERQVDRGETPTKSRIARLKTFGELIDLHIDDMCDVGKSPRRSKAAALDMLRRHLGKCNIAALDRERLIRFGRDRADQGAGPMTLGIDIGFIKLILAHAAAVHGLPVKVEPVDLARIALKRLGLIGKGHQRDRRPTQDELDRLIGHFDANPRQIAPLSQIIRFAVATAMRQEEICKVRWSDLESRTRMLLIRDRKDPRNKNGNNQRIPLFAATGYDAWAIVEEQRAKRSNDDDRIFPFNHRSVGTAFRRGCTDLSIHDLHFHDLRHEGTSRLFEAGFTIEQVALVTGHKDWKMLKRYTHLKPEALHALLAARAA